MSTFPIHAARTLLATTVAGALLAGALGAPPGPEPADVEYPLVLAPGVTEPREEPATWELDLRGLDAEEAQEAAEGVSSRLYGPRDAGLDEPLVLRTDFAEDTLLGVEVSAVCLCGADLDIAVDDVFFHRLTWEPASSTIRPETVYYLRVPAGERRVSLRTANGGPVVVDTYTYATDVAQLPGDAPPVELLQEEEPPPPPEPNQPWDGYRGIWFELGQRTEWGDKYSGGLGTYTMKHSPLAVYAPEVDRTFFTYGGTTEEGQRDLLIMAGEYDHRRHQVSRPVVVDTKPGVDDPHDNASIALDDQGYVWLFVNGRAGGRPGFKYRSTEPYSTAEFELVTTEEMTYPQPRYVEGRGFFNNFTKYTAGRELYWETSPDGEEWSEDRKLAGFGGHYQVSEERDGTIVTAFNYHPGGVDTRTNVYVAMTQDFGETWTTMDGTVLETPLTDRDNPALVADYEAQGLLTYVKDIRIDEDGNPVLLHLTSGDYRPGPDGDPRTWRILRWTGAEWENTPVTTSDHNYDSGSLYLEDDRWTAYIPSGTGPQAYQTGGEMVLWDSVDQGRTWEPRREVTEDSEANHGYARRALEGTDPFYAFWADGDPTEFGPSRLHMGDSEGRYWQYPYTMTQDRETPELRCSSPDPAHRIVVNGIDTGIPNRAAWGGCSVTDVLEGDRDWDGRRYVTAHVAGVTERAVEEGALQDWERVVLVLLVALTWPGR